MASAVIEPEGRISEVQIEGLVRCLLLRVVSGLEEG